MANDWDDDDDFNEEPRRQDNESSAIRSARKAEREKDKALKDALAELATVKESLRERAVKDAITSKNLNPKIAALVPKDLAPEAVDQWVADYSDVFGVPVQGQSQENPEGSQPADDPLVEALARIGSNTASGTPVNGSVDQLNARIAATTTLEELNQLIHGNPNGPSAF